MPTSLNVRDLMTSRVFSVAPDDSLATVYDLMDSLHVRHIPVVEKTELRGLVSYSDLVREALFADGDLPLSEQRELLESRRAGEIMREGIETVSPDESVAEAGRIMLDNKFGCLPVTEGTRVVGILTEADFVRFVVQRVSERRVA